MDMRYGPLTLNIKMCATSYSTESLKHNNVDYLCLCLE